MSSASELESSLQLDKESDCEKGVCEGGGGAIIRRRRLIEGRDYSRKYGNLASVG